MRYSFFTLLLLLSFSATAQHFSEGNEFGMYVETDCPAYAIRTIIQHEGKLSDSCPPLLSKNEKDIYILKEPYFKGLPDTFKGYRIHYINADSDTHYWYKRQQEEHIHIYYFSTMFNYIEFYHFWIIPVEMKKKKVTFANRGYKVNFYFLQLHSMYEYKRTEYIEWKD